MNSHLSGDVASQPASYSNTEMDAVQTHDLYKSYGNKEVLHRLNLRVPQGCLFGFLGPNGAGKTTTIRILLGLLRASSGEARILGQDVWRKGSTVRADVGYLPGDVRFYDDMTGRATLAFLDRARGRPVDGGIKRLAEAFDLNLDMRVRDYSRGMKQKLGLIQALMHQPRLVVLDEPTIALDPLVRKTLYQELRQVAREGRTVLFSSHTLSEVEELCDHVAIVRDGYLVEQSRIETLQQAAVRHVEVQFDRHQPLPYTSPDGLRILYQADNHVAGTWAGHVGPLLDWLAGCDVEDVTIGEPDLQDLFMAYYTDAAVEQIA
ncbi:MAG: ABC transporter ATP-binding protein [Planctomycetota bacterium]